MTKFTKRGLSLLLLLSLLISVFALNVSAAQISTPATGYTSAQQVQYKTVNQGGKQVIVNWGARGEDCVFLSTKAQIGRAHV